MALATVNKSSTHQCEGRHKKASTSKQSDNKRRKSANCWRGRTNSPDFSADLATQDSWPAFPMANRMQRKTAKVAILEQLKVHTSTSALHSETRRTRTGTGLCVSKHASKEHASSYHNSCRGGGIPFTVGTPGLVRCGPHCASCRTLTKIGWSL